MSAKRNFKLARYQDFWFFFTKKPLSSPGRDFAARRQIFRRRDQLVSACVFTQKRTRELAAAAFCRRCADADVIGLAAGAFDAYDIRNSKAAFPELFAAFKKFAKNPE